MRTCEVHVHETGFTVLHRGGDNPKADVVFVHGLLGHPRKTWSTKASESKTAIQPNGPITRRMATRLFRPLRVESQPPRSKSKKRKWSVGGSLADQQPQDDAGGDESPCDSSEGDVFWPLDLLAKSERDVRVLTFGYSSNPGGPSHDNLYILSKELLLKLSNERRRARNRPIIFVAHSLGGILTKFALKISQESIGANAKLSAIRNSTRGVIFFGTPHSGSDMASWGEVIRRIAGVCSSTNPTLLAALNTTADNGQLEELRRSFSSMLGPRAEGKFQAFNFREKRPLMNGLGPATKPVVQFNSSGIDSIWASDLTVDANHLEICKFNGPEDRKYLDFLNELQERFLSEIEEEVREESSRGRRVELNPKKTEWIHLLNVCPYGDRKNVNPRRVEGTCKWFTGHRRFKNWKQSDRASLLWVSADPGCGKSVLARYLVDEELRHADEERGALDEDMGAPGARTICYFFFKDGFDDQKFATTAMCCILRQLFRQRPECFSEQIIKKLEEDKKVEQGRKTPPTSFYDLWGLFMAAVAGHTSGEIICVIDALDECEEMGRNRLLEALVEFYSDITRATPKLKFLLSSRPYSNIEGRLRDLERKVPTIHLSGEDEREVRKITREIDLVIRSRVFSMHRLGPEEKEVLIEELTKTENRTYLWVHLVFDQMEETSLLSQGRIRSRARKLPKTVDEAYEKILSKSQDVDLTRKLLHIVLAAREPLTLEEMAVCLAIRPSHKTWDDLEQDLIPEAQFCQEVRDLCGLFVVQVDRKIYLLHQTAREFLIPTLSSGPSPELQWKSTFYPGESHRVLTEICLWRLSLRDVCRSCFMRSLERDEAEDYIDERTLLKYAADSWPYHLRDCDWEIGEELLEGVLSYFCPRSPRSSAWFEICRYRATGESRWPEDFEPLCVASYFGLVALVQWLLNTGTDANGFGSTTPLHYAAIYGHADVVQQLLEAGANISSVDSGDCSPLYYASEAGHVGVVQKLLLAGASVGVRVDNGFEPLHAAAFHGYDIVVKQLLTAQANSNAKDHEGRTPLWFACAKGHEVIVRRLLGAGADVAVENVYGMTPLHVASLCGMYVVVQPLLKAGADVDARCNKGCTPLYLASLERHYSVVKSLLEAGADANAMSKDGETPLDLAAFYDGENIMELLLEAGAQSE